MADVTGGIPPTGASEFDVPGDIKAVYDHFGAPTMFSVANSAALPASDNWVGRILTTSDTGFVWRWNGSWKIIWSDGEQDLTLLNSFTDASAGAATAFRDGIMVRLDGGLNRGTAPVAGVIAFTLPVGWRPRTQQYGKGRGDMEYVIETNGNFTLFSGSALSGAGWTLGHIEFIQGN